MESELCVDDDDEKNDAHKAIVCSRDASQRQSFNSNLSSPDGTFVLSENNDSARQEVGAEESGRDNPVWLEQYTEKLFQYHKTRILNREDLADTVLHAVTDILQARSFAGTFCGLAFHFGAVKPNPGDKIIQFFHNARHRFVLAVQTKTKQISIFDSLLSNSTNGGS